MLPLSLLIIDPHQIFRRSAYAYVLKFREFRSVEVAAGYHEALLLMAQFFPDLILIDGNLLFNKPIFTKEIEKLKHANPALDVLALFIFKDSFINRCQLLSPLVSGVIFKDNFGEGLVEYLASRKEQLAGGKNIFFEGVD